MSTPKHLNNGNCPHCEYLFNVYPNFNKDLYQWFKSFQKKNPEAHISCAGRGKEKQLEALRNKTSKANYGQSAHNYNCAIDVFVNLPNKNIYDKDWFNKKLKTYLNHEKFTWYGMPGAPFPELPHVEVKNWRDLIKPQGDVDKILPPKEILQKLT